MIEYKIRKIIKTPTSTLIDFIVYEGDFSEPTLTYPDGTEYVCPVFKINKILLEKDVTFNEVLSEGTIKKILNNFIYKYGIDTSHVVYPFQNKLDTTLKLEIEINVRN